MTLMPSKKLKSRLKEQIRQLKDKKSQNQLKKTKSTGFFAFLDLFRSILNFSMEFWADGIDFVATISDLDDKFGLKKSIKDDLNPILDKILG